MPHEGLACGLAYRFVAGKSVNQRPFATTARMRWRFSHILQRIRSSSRHSEMNVQVPKAGGDH
jgi:hypothetical protein